MTRKRWELGRSGIGLATPEHDTSDGGPSLTRQELNSEAQSHVTNGRCYRLADTFAVSLRAFRSDPKATRTSISTAPGTVNGEMVIVAPVFSVPVGYGGWRLRSHSDEGSPLVNHVTRTPPRTEQNSASIRSPFGGANLNSIFYSLGV